MWSSFIQFFSAPRFFDSEEKNRQAEVLNAVLVGQLVTTTLGTVGGVLFLFANKELAALIALLVIAIMLGLKIGLNAGYVRFVGASNTLALWPIITSLVYLSGGVSSTGTFFYFAITLATGLTVGMRGAFVAAAASSLSLLGMALAENAGYSFPRLLPQPPQSGWLTFTISLAWVLAPLYITLKRLSEAIQQIRQELIERELAEEALRESEERYRLISSVSSDYVFASRLNSEDVFQLDWVVGAFETITGYTAEEFVAHGGWPACLHPDHIEQDAHDQAVLQTNKPVVTEVRIIRKDGNVRWVRVYAHPIWDDEAQQLIGVNGAVQDITERKRAEEELRQTLEMEQRRARQLSTLHTAALAAASHTREDDLIEDFIEIAREVFQPDIFGIALWDEQAGVLRGHPGSQGIPPEFLETPILPGQGVLGDVAATRQAQRLDHVAQDATYIAADPEIRSELCVPITAGEQLIGVIDVESKLPNAFSDADARLLLTLAGQLATAIERLRAVAEIRQLNADLETRVQERTIQLEAANKELESFSYSISHDLRSPLRTILGFSHILVDDYGPVLDPEALDLMQRVVNRGEYMDQMIDALLNFSRLSRRPLHRETIDLQQIAQQIINEYRLSRQNAQVQFQLDDLPACEADPTLIRQVLDNLIGNALKYAQYQSPPQITIGWLAGEAEPIYFVRDNGAGFDMQYVGKLFGVFQRLHRADEFEGTGVGLATVQRIIHRHGGQVWAEAEVNKGATFYFTLGY